MRNTVKHLNQRKATGLDNLRCLLAKMIQLEVNPFFLLRLAYLCWRSNECEQASKQAMKLIALQLPMYLKQGYPCDEIIITISEKFQRNLIMKGNQIKINFSLISYIFNILDNGVLK